MGSVQVAMREQVACGGAEHPEVVGTTEHALLHRDEHGARDVEAQQPVASAQRHGSGSYRPMRRSVKRVGGGAYVCCGMRAAMASRVRCVSQPETLPRLWRNRPAVRRASANASATVASTSSGSSNAA